MMRVRLQEIVHKVWPLAVSALMLVSCRGAEGVLVEAVEARSDAISTCPGTRPVMPCVSTYCDADTNTWQYDPLPEGTVCGQGGYCDDWQVCVTPPPPPVARTPHIFDWTPDSRAGNNASAFGGSLAAAGNFVWMVHTGSDYFDSTIWLSKFDGLNWTENQRVPQKLSATRPTIAAFNGYIYMLHTGADFRDDAVWMSRLNPVDSTWTPDVRLPYRSSQSPSMAVFNGKLYMLGHERNTNEIWQVTMDADEHFSAATPVGFGSTSVQSPALAVHFPTGSPTNQSPGTLWMAFCGPNWTPSSNVAIYVSQLSAAGTWTQPTYSGQESTYGPALVSFQGSLQLVHNGATDDTMVWSYLQSGNTWSAPVSLYTFRSFGHSPAMAVLNNPLFTEIVMVHPSAASSHDAFPVFGTPDMSIFYSVYR